MVEDLDEWENFQIENDEVRNFLLSYLTIKCDFISTNTTLFEQHQIECMKYHNDNQRRRKPFKDGKMQYINELCDLNCSKGDSCRKCHNLYEKNYHPAEYKTTKCTICPTIKYKYCHYTHSDHELRNGNLYIKTSNSTKISMSDRQIIQSANFDLIAFKTFMCYSSSKHNEKQCLNFHSLKDRRRNLTIFEYEPELCKFADSDENLCPNKDACRKSHNKVESFYHPSKFKTKFCSLFNLDNPELVNKCSYGPFCSFAHSEKEIKIELIHQILRNEEFLLYYFKTVLCPFTHVHEKSICVYAHNWQDFRRNPKKILYKNKSCKKWDIKKTILNYNEGCPKGYDCQLCHGWKEEDYHPLNLKTRKCKNFNKVCDKKEYCPFYHNYEIKRKVPQEFKEEYESKFQTINNEIKNKNVINNQNSTRINTLNLFVEHTNRTNRSDIINYNNKFEINSPLNNSDNELLPKKLSLNSKVFIPKQNKNNSFNITPMKYNFYSNNTPVDHFSPNISYNSFSNLSDNENDNKNGNSSKFPARYSSNSNYMYTHTSRLSSSSENFTDNLTESFRYESGGGLINPDDSIESYRYDYKAQERNLDNLEKNNNLLKQLLKESDLYLSNNNKDLGNNNKEDFMSYLYINNFMMLYEKINSSELELKNLLKLSDDHILLYVERENLDKFSELRSKIMSLELNMDGEDLLNIINSDFVNINDYA